MRAAALVVATLAIGAARSTPAPLGPHAIGSVRFGTSKPAAVVALAKLFGTPTARVVNTGCGRRYTEVVWRDLAAEFRGGMFSGYRYIAGGYPPTTARERRTTFAPALRTAAGITLGATLADVRAAYGRLRFIGVDRWQAADGLVFVDNAQHDPEPPTSRIVEIRIGTCGDF